MKKALLLVAVLLLSATAVMAVPAETTYNIEGKSNFTYLSVAGQTTVGNPGFIELKGYVSPTSSTPINYYLWVNGLGKVCVASYPTISAYASFPNGNWAGGAMNSACTVIGGQS